MADVRDNPTRPGGGGDKRDPRGLRGAPPATRPSDPAPLRDLPPPRPAPAAPSESRTLPAPGRSSATGVEVPRFGLTRGDQLFVAVLVGAAVVLMSVHWLSLSDFGRKEVEIDRLPPAQYEYIVDVNTATWVEFAQFEGIGETLARRIVEDRQRKGPFRRVDDLLRVSGIGPAKLEAMRRHLSVGTEHETQ